MDDEILFFTRPSQLLERDERESEETEQTRKRTYQERKEVQSAQKDYERQKRFEEIDKGEGDFYNLSYEDKVLYVKRHYGSFVYMAMCIEMAQTETQLKRIRATYKGEEYVRHIDTLINDIYETFERLNGIGPNGLTHLYFNNQKQG